MRLHKDEVTTFGLSIIIDNCPKCDGTWLDEGELHKVLKDRALSDYLTRDIGTASDSPLICPRCKGLMTVERADDVEVDVCLSCNGVWLDGGELDALRTMSQDGFEADETEKTLKRWDEETSGVRRTRLDRFLRKLTRR